MDSERFDRWAKLLALRMSRRTAVAGLGTAAVASLASPRWVLGQDDDDDQDDDDQGGDDTGDGGNDTSDDQDGDQDPDDVGWEVCADIDRCKLYHCSDSSADGTPNCEFSDVGEIPGGPYPQEFVLKNFPNVCTPIGHTLDELAAKCNATYPGKDCFKCCSRSGVGDNICSACTSSISVYNCH